MGRVISKLHSTPSGTKPTAVTASLCDVRSILEAKLELDPAVAHTKAFDLHSINIYHVNLRLVQI